MKKWSRAFEGRADVEVKRVQAYYNISKEQAEQVIFGTIASGTFNGEEILFEDVDHYAFTIQVSSSFCKVYKIHNKSLAETFPQSIINSMKENFQKKKFRYEDAYAETRDLIFKPVSKDRSRRRSTVSNPYGLSPEKTKNEKSAPKLLSSPGFIKILGNSNSSTTLRRKSILDTCQKIPISTYRQTLVTESEGQSPRGLEGTLKSFNLTYDNRDNNKLSNIKRSSTPNLALRDTLKSSVFYGSVHKPLPVQQPENTVLKKKFDITFSSRMQALSQSPKDKSKLPFLLAPPTGKDRNHNRRKSLFCNNS
jgi:hypothetical protein